MSSCLGDTRMSKVVLIIELINELKGLFQNKQGVKDIDFSGSNIRIKFVNFDVTQLIMKQVSK